MWATAGASGRHRGGHAATRKEEAMKLCFPVAHDRGLDSHIHPHFGSTPIFLVVDTETGATRSIANGSCEHEHGHCDPLAALAGADVNAIVVSGIGAGALERLRAADVDVYFSGPMTVATALAAIRGRVLRPMRPEDALARGLGCGHHHGAEHDHPGRHRHRHGQA
jgi:predicted Fe-Mo cluster-binding NifX family protein